jgi:hypothetical protein
MKLLARRALSLLAWPPLLLAVAGCGNQREGERCDERNINADCDEGLICTNPYINGYHHICCPAPGIPVTVAACNAGTAPPPEGGVADAPTVDTRAEGGPEAGAPETGGNDATSEATDDRSSVDARPDTSPDVSADASNEGGGDAAPGDAPDDVASPDQTSVDAADGASPPDASGPDVSLDTPADSADEISADGPVIDVPTLDTQDAPVVDAPADAQG